MAKSVVTAATIFRDFSLDNKLLTFSSIIPQMIQRHRMISQSIKHSSERETQIKAS